MTRSAHIRVDRLSFIAALEVRLDTFIKFEEMFDKEVSKHRSNVKAIEDKHNAALNAWADKIKEEGLFTYKVWSNSVELIVDPKHEAKRPRLERGYDNWPESLTELEGTAPAKYSRFGVREIENTLNLLKLSTDETISTYTYSNVAQYI